MTTSEAKKNGMICVGEYGYGGKSGYFWATPANATAAKAAYDALPDVPAVHEQRELEEIESISVWVEDDDDAK